MIPEKETEENQSKAVQFPTTIDINEQELPKFTQVKRDNEENEENEKTKKHEKKRRMYSMLMRMTM